MAKQTDLKEHKIMNQTLPEILDELEAWHNQNKALIAQMEGMLIEINTAISDAKKAADEARAAGLAAAADAMAAGMAAAVRIREDTTAMITGLADDIRKEALAVDRAILAAKEMHIDGSPFLKVE